jgi:DNA uptake protein ComE-like DNA-binding protein
MRGGLKLSERGVIPRLLSGVYRRGRKVVKDSGGETSVSVSLSYYEIYNDKVFDLFEPPEKRTPAGLPLREKDGKTIVVGLSERACDDLKDFETLYIEANNNRSTAGTKLNAQSSRSHAILMVKVTQITGDEIKVSTASAIDLAGSEDNRRTENGKERMVESASINKSLFVLSQCIDAIGRGDKRIPYRESKMTRILSLGQNNGITIMILNLAPLRSYHLDTLSSLNVSSRAKRIEVREIENEVVFKQAPRTSSSIAGSNIQRQPLRPLANAHNTHVTAAAATKAGDKPIKAFSVYSDRKAPVLKATVGATSIARTNSVKRSSDEAVNGRATKMTRPNAVTRPALELSTAKIEEMVERKVSEILASRAANQPAPSPVATISEDVQRRLDALERKIESNGAQEDARNEGLRFLLMAKQHKEHGQDTSALKMYEMAQPYFPGQQKLQKKIDILRAKIQAKKEAERPAAESRKTLATKPIIQLPTPVASFEEPGRSPVTKKRKIAYDHDSDEDFNISGTHNAGNEYEDEDSFACKPAKSRRIKPKSTLKIFEDDAYPSGSLTPRARHLLNVVNSRDISQIKGLSGVGAKKAQDLLDFLDLQSEEDGGRIESLRQLTAVPGMGAKTVEKMYEGLGVC